MAIVTLCFAVGINMIYEAYSGNEVLSSDGPVKMRNTFSK